jgi:hypothetical protein
VARGAPLSAKATIGRPGAHARFARGRARADWIHRNSREPAMNPSRLEHLNVTLTDLDRATRALQAIVPQWSVRGAGTWDDGDGRSHAWRHVGDDFQYLALYEAAPGSALQASGPGSAFNHLALVVDDLDAALARLRAVGIALDHVGGSTEHRRSAYVMIEPERLQVELVAYDSPVPSERNVYV